MFSYCSRGHHRHSVLYRFTAGRDCSSYHRWGWFNLQWDPISSNPIEFSGSCQKNFLQSFWPWRVWLARRHHLVLWDQTQKSLQACQRFPKLKEDTSIKFYPIMRLHLQVPNGPLDKDGLDQALAGSVHCLEHPNFFSHFHTQAVHKKSRATAHPNNKNHRQ